MRMDVNGIPWLVIQKLGGGFTVRVWRELWDNDVVTIEKRVATGWEEIDEKDWTRLGA